MTSQHMWSVLYIYYVIKWTHACKPSMHLQSGLIFVITGDYLYETFVPLQYHAKWEESIECKFISPPLCLNDGPEIVHNHWSICCKSSTCANCSGWKVHFSFLKIFQTQFTIYLSTKFVFWWYVIFKEGKLLSTIISWSKSSVSVKIHWWTVIQVTVLQSVLTVTSNMTDIRLVHHLSLLCYQIVSKLICFQCFGTW